ncbi:M23 family metallopeptidase [Paenibacillus sediminis]|uniref:Murein DD-endopeptidase MepM/ murein hydrolase activator NlpD n=1 Tax=Paenibacillus sediminis TaxID=664909 RepID=A0ABS4H5Z7_9BACL|nr:M23 family metallopeptidase [Paenibacillus sediminis]MBP1937968.1 murein DD-endopeptidase MepM/ murein hydrolase activator NlpD [Paenibacillus sediminis]
MISISQFSLLCLRCAAYGLIASIIWLNTSAYAKAEEKASVSKTSPPKQVENIYDSRKILYDKMSVLTNIPWYRLAAIDQYERTMTKAHPKDRKHPERLTGIFMSEPAWTGWLNPDPKDVNPKSIEIFAGYGRDGSGDGIADANNDVDVLYSMASHLLKYGYADDDFYIALWDYYQNSRAVQRIQQFAKIYQTFDRLDLFEHAFPLPIGNSYAYHDTWGSARGWGGNRIHEGTDLFAYYGLPVRSTCYGIIEVKGWNPFGGWRIGIRDLENRYHYYAHLSGYNKSINIGDVVTPGQTIGWVGSSGYGKPGTQGKFPPHLHYGIYRDRGLVEWSFDPYPLLRQWEIEERKRLKKGKTVPSS